MSNVFWINGGPLGPPVSDVFGSIEVGWDPREGRDVFGSMEVGWDPMLVTVTFWINGGRLDWFFKVVSWFFMVLGWFQ